jgi:homoserine kinase
VSSLRRDAVRVVVPATSANLGPGFDCAGLALSIYDELVAMATDDPGVLIEVSGEGAGAVPVDESHLVVRSMRAGFAWLGVEAPGFLLRCVNVIPHGRGLGSSAAAIVGGIVLARAMVDDGPERMTDADVLQVALALESHPDNLAAALLGGFTVAWIEDDGRADAVTREVDVRVRPVVLVPPTELRTATARALLPESLPFAEAAHNVGRAALLVHALSSDPARLMSATEDRMHQARRATAYPESVALVEQLRSLGVPAVISGAGPTVLALADDATVDVVLAAAGESWRAAEVGVSPTGAREVPLPLEG